MDVASVGKTLNVNQNSTSAPRSDHALPLLNSYTLFFPYESLFEIIPISGSERCGGLVCFQSESLRKQKLTVKPVVSKYVPLIGRTDRQFCLRQSRHVDFEKRHEFPTHKFMCRKMYGDIDTIKLLAGAAARISEQGHARRPNARQLPLFVDW